MGKKMKLTGILATVVLALVASLLALWCVSPFALWSSSVAEKGDTFAMDTVASLRYSKKEMRFRVKMDEQTKEFAQGADQIGMIIASKDEFEGKSGDEYLTIGAPVTVSADSIYEEGGFFYFNGAIAIEDGQKETQFSAAAYIKSGSDYTWTSVSDSHSVHSVASKLWFTISRAQIENTYEIGTQEFPVLIGGSGKNSYSALLTAEDGGLTSGTYFKLTEDLVVEREFAGNLDKGGFVACTLADMYTVNHKVTDVYPVGKEIDLKEKVDAQFGDVIYELKSAPADAGTVTVNDGAFMPTVAGEYVVSAYVDGIAPCNFTVEVGNSNYAKGLVWDATSEEVEKLTAQEQFEYTSGADDSTVSVTFDESMKFDSKSSGSLKFSSSHKTGSNIQYSVPMTPAYSKAYYEALQEDGYTNIAFRMKIQLSNTTGSSVFHFIPLYLSSAKFAMEIYGEDGYANLTTYEGYELMGYHFAGVLDKFQNVVGQWIELTIPIDSFLEKYYTGSPWKMFMIQDTTGSNLDTTLWIDNIYAVKAAGGSYDNDTQDMTDEFGQEIDVYEKIGYDGSADIGDADVFTDAKFYDMPISIENGKCMLDKRGYYSFSVRARNRFGIFGRFKALSDKGIVHTRLDTTGFSKGTETATGQIEYVTDKKYDDDDFGSVKITATATAAGQSLEVYLKPEFNVAHYQDLKDNGYNYVDFRFKVEQTGCNNSVIYTFTNITYYEANNKDGSQIKTATNREMWTDTTWGASTYGWYIQRFKIDEIIASYISIGSLYIKIQAGASGTLNLYFGGAYAVKV